MKKFYDKLLLLLAALALLGGVAFYVLKSDDTQNVRPDPAPDSAGDAYQAIPIPESVPKTAEWPEPGPQSSGPNWLYDVFTPPKIYLVNGVFDPRPPKLPATGKPFGIYLEEISRKPYRIQIQGFSGDRNKPKECVLFFFDEERQLRFFIRPGQTNKESEVEVIDFSINREIDPNNNVKVTAEATILDNRSGETVKLVDGERLFESEISIILRSKENPEVLIELSGAGTSFDTPAGQYILKEINLEDQTVTVEKQATEEVEAETRTLSAKSFNLPVTTQPVKETTESPSDVGEFDFVF